VHTFAFALGSAGGQRSDVFIREHVIRASLDLELVVRLHRRSPVPPPFARDAARSIREEVDVVIEAGGKLLPIEVKASASPRLADCAHLRSFSTPSAASNGSLARLEVGGSFELPPLRGDRPSRAGGRPALSGSRPAEPGASAQQNLAATPGAAVVS
jgi:hypothetical protein